MNPCKIVSYLNHDNTFLIVGIYHYHKLNIGSFMNIPSFRDSITFM